MLSLKMLLEEDVISEKKFSNKMSSKSFGGATIGGGQDSRAAVPGAVVGRAKIPQPPRAREIGFPYRDYEDEDDDLQKSDDEDDNVYSDLDTAAKFRNMTGAAMYEPTKMKDPGDDTYAITRNRQMKQQSRGGSSHAIEFEDENDVDESILHELEGRSMYSLYLRQPGHTGNSLFQQPSKNKGAYMQGAAVAHPGQGPKGWASGIPNDYEDDLRDENEEETMSNIRKYVKHQTKKLKEELKMTSVYGRGGSGSTGRFGGYHGINTWAKPIIHKNTFTDKTKKTFENEDDYDFLRWYSDEDFSDEEMPVHAKEKKKGI